LKTRNKGAIGAPSRGIEALDLPEQMKLNEWFPWSQQHPELTRRMNR
jgi:hypothetical protein